MNLGAQRVHRDDNLRTATKRRRNCWDAHRNVAGIGDDDGVCLEQLGVALDQIIEAFAAALFGALHQHGDVALRPAELLRRTQGSKVHDHVALAIGGAAAVPAAVAFAQLESAGDPQVGVAGGNHVVVAVQQDRRGSVA